MGEGIPCLCCHVTGAAIYIWKVPSLNTFSRDISTSFPGSPILLSPGGKMSDTGKEVGGHLMSIEGASLSLLMQDIHDMFVISSRKSILMLSRAWTSGRNVLIKKNYVGRKIKPTCCPCEAQSSLTDEKTDHLHNPHG